MKGVLFLKNMELDKENKHDGSIKFSSIQRNEIGVKFGFKARNNFGKHVTVAKEYLWEEIQLLIVEDVVVFPISQKEDNEEDFIFEGGNFEGGNEDGTTNT